LDSIDSSIETLQKFLLNAFRQSSTYQHHKKRARVYEGDDQAAIDKLIKLRNYYRRKYQRTGINRFKIFRNILNNHVKSALTEARNKYWANKLKTLNTKDNTLWKTMKSLQRKRIPPPPLILPNQNIAYDPIQKCEAIAKNFYSVHSQAAALTSPFTPVVDDYINQLEHQADMIPPVNII